MNKYHTDFVRIGLNIMYYRKLHGLTQMQLADLTGFSRNHIQSIEKAKVTPSVVALFAISEALKINITQLFESK